MDYSKQLRLVPSTIADVDEAIKLIYSSGPAAFEYVFKNEEVNALEFLKYAFIREDGEFSFDNHYSLYYKEELVGIGSIFDEKRASTFTLSDAINILKFYGLSSFSIMIHGLKIEQIIKLPKGNEIAIAHLGIKEEYRGRGLGTYLIENLIKKYKGEHSNYVLDVSEENPRAKSLYERLGFKVTKRNESNLKSKYSYVAHHLRMEYMSS